jgi:hypothetical protein
MLMEDVERVDCETCHVTFPKSRVQCPCCGEAPPVKHITFHLTCTLPPVQFYNDKYYHCGQIINCSDFDLPRHRSKLSEFIEMIESSNVYYCIENFTDMIDLPPLNAGHHPNTTNEIRGTLFTTDTSFINGKVRHDMFVDAHQGPTGCQRGDFPFDESSTNFYNAMDKMFKNIDPEKRFYLEIEKNHELMLKLGIDELHHSGQSIFDVVPMTSKMLLSIKNIWDKLKGITFKVPIPRYRDYITRAYQKHLVRKLLEKDNDNATST